MLVSAIASAAGGLISAVGAIQAGNAQARANDYNAQINEKNAQISERNRRALVDQSSQEVADLKRKNRQRLSAIRAAYGASGIDLEGTPLEVIQATALEGELDVRRAKYAGDLAIVGKEDEAASFREQAQLNRMGADSARTAGKIGAVTQLFGGFSQAGTTLLKAA